MFSYVVATALAILVSAEYPGAVFWHSQPVYPNETLFITGGPWTTADNLVMVLSDVHNKQVTLNSSATTNFTMAFVIPSSFAPGVFWYQLVYPNGSKFCDIKAVNLPNVWFIQGDAATYATPGGWIGTYGSTLFLGPNMPTAYLSLKSDSSKIYNLSQRDIGSQNRWAQYFSISDSVPTGEYELFTSNGAAGDRGYSKFSNDIGSTIITTVFIKEDYLNGLRNIKTRVEMNLSSKITVENQFKAALKACNNGGTIYFPSGIYNFVSATFFSIPNGVIITGDGPLNSIINRYQSSDRYFLSGGAFVIENVSISNVVKAKSFHQCGCQLIAKVSAGYSKIQNSHFNCTDVEKTSDNKRLCDIGHQRGTIFTKADSLILDTVKMDQCNHCLLIDFTSHVRVTNSDIRFRVLYMRVMCSRNTVFEKSTRTLIGDNISNNWNLDPGQQPGSKLSDQKNAAGRFCTSASRDLYYGEHVSHQTIPGLAFDNTWSDRKHGMYYGKMRSILADRKTIMLVGPWFDLGSKLSPGAIVMIVGGRGLGQYRFVQSVGNNFAVTVSREWDVLPDNSTIFSITIHKGHQIVANNDFRTEGNHGISYFSSTDIIEADNTYGINGTNFWMVSRNSRTNTGLIGGFNYGDSKGPGSHNGPWYSQFLSNNIRPGSTGLFYRISSRPPIKSVSKWSNIVGFGNIVRNNKNPGVMPFDIDMTHYVGPSIVEGNTNLNGITLENIGNDNILVRKNTFIPKEQQTQFIGWKWLFSKAGGNIYCRRPSDHWLTTICPNYVNID